MISDMAEKRIDGVVSVNSSMRQFFAFCAGELTINIDVFSYLAFELYSRIIP